MTDFSLIFLVGLFFPGLIRGAFWYDSPAGIEGIIWTICTIVFVLTAGWVAGKIFGYGLGPTIVMLLAAVVANGYAISGVTLYSKTPNVGPDDIDGDINE